MPKQKEAKVTIGFKTDGYIKDILQEIADREDRTISSVVNRIVRNALTADIQKVLEGQNNENI